MFKKHPNKLIAFLLFSLALFTLNAWADDDGCNAVDSGPWTLDAQQPSTCVPYPTGLFGKRLPMDVMDHLYSNDTYSGDQIASFAITGYGTQGSSNYGLTQWATPDGYEDGNSSIPVYYGQSSDPIYKITSVTPSSYEEDALNTYWHIPDQAEFSGWSEYGGGKATDMFLVVWDQTTNEVLSLYNWGVYTAGKLSHCTAASEAAADADANCHISAHYPTISDYSDDIDYQLSHSLWMLSNGPMTFLVRGEELINGEIPHALYGHAPCFNNNTDNYVFPALHGPWSECSTVGISDEDKYPTMGNLLFLDYTDAQIAAMSLPASQKAYITALAHYGMYIAEGQPRYEPFIITWQESGRAWEVDGSTAPVYAYVASQGWSCWSGDPTGGSSTCRYSKYILSGIPNMEGPNCPGSTCGVLQHVHIADECVARGMAGLTGGCGTIYTVSSVSAGSVTQTGATITWTSNFGGDSEVNYGLTDAYGVRSYTSESVTNHSVVLSGLTENTEYHYQVCSNDICSSDGTFTTSATDVTPVISSVVGTSTGYYTATITWTTDVGSDSYVSYGLTVAYGSSAGQSETVTSHSVALTGLSYGTTYHFRVSSSYSTYTAVSGDDTFTTDAVGARAGDNMLMLMP